MTTLSDFSAAAIDGTDTDLSAYDGKVVLVVNTASQCGFTGQYKGLQQLHDTYEDQGLVVLGFPCNQFGGQEPGDEAQIGEFCQRNYGVTFPMFAKVEVNGAQTHPLWKWLKKEKGGLLGIDAITGHHARWCGPAPKGVVSVGAQVRAHGEEIPATAWADREADGEHVEVRLARRIRGVSPGQSVVLYDGTRVVGSATIAVARLSR